MSVGSRAPRRLLCGLAALTALVPSGCGSSSGSGPPSVRSRLERSVTAAQHQVRGFAVKRPARCDDAGGGVWTCRIQVLTASPEGATDAVDIDYRVKLGAGSCWTATFASGRASPLHACLR